MSGFPTVSRTEVLTYYWIFNSIKDNYIDESKLVKKIKTMWKFKTGEVVKYLELFL